ncbi:MAG TPA: hypothetical protein VI959_03870 [Alphaproteobacteria bacterium]|nr:hypothetical protein [Alphaproteobacteria bacterium]
MPKDLDTYKGFLLENEAYDSSLAFEEATIADLIVYIKSGKKFLFERCKKSSGLDFEYCWKNIRPSFRLNCTSKFALKNDVSELLKVYFHEEGHLPLFYDPLLTSIYEAWSNSLIWSNLEVPSQKEILKDPLVMGEILQKSLENEVFSSRRLQLSLYLTPLKVVCLIQHEGLPFYWNEEDACKRPLTRGIGIIKAFSDKVSSHNQGKALELVFYHRKGQ